MNFRLAKLPMLPTLRSLLASPHDAPRAIEPLESRQLLSADVLSLADPAIFEVPSPQRLLGAGGFILAANLTQEPGEEVATFSETDIRFYSFSNATTMNELRSLRIPYASPGVQPVSIDANGDGALDLVCGKWLSLNDGTGNFSSRWSIVAPDRQGAWVTTVIAARLNADSALDLVFEYSDRSIAFMLSSGAGTFTLAASTPADVPPPWALVPPIQLIRNFANSGTDAVYFSRTTSALSLAGNTVVRTPLVAAGGFVPFATLSFADIDSDGITDAYVGTTTDVAGTIFYKGLASGSFQAASQLFGDLSLMRVVDLDNDGRSDLYAQRMLRSGYFAATWFTPGAAYVALGDQPLSTPLLPKALGENRLSISPSLLTFIDVDRDGDRDIVQFGVNPPVGTDTTTLSLFVGVQTVGSRVSTTSLVVAAPPSPNLSLYQVRALIPDGARAYLDRGTPGFSYSDRDPISFSTNEFDPDPLPDVLFQLDTPGRSHRLFVIAPDRRSITEYNFTLWTSIFIPEGWRNPLTVNQYLPLVNPNEEPVNYRVILRYASGVRDQVFTTGTLAPHSRGSVILAERGRPSTIRPNEAYSIEVQSNGEIGATLVHYDSLGQTGRGRAVGESLRSDAQTTWTFGDLDATDLDFLLFFTTKAATVRVQLFAENQPTLTQTIALDTLRRGGLLVRDVPGAVPGVRYTARVESTQPIFASLTSYGADRASLSWGLTGLGTASLLDSGSVVSVRTALTSSLVLANTSSQAESLSLSIKPSNGPAQTITLSLAAGASQVLDLAPYALQGTTSLGLSLRTLAQGATSSPITMTLRQRDAARGDIGRTTADRTAKYFHLFAEGFINPRDRTNAIEDTINVYNPANFSQEIYLRFFLPDGRVARHSLVLPALSGTSIRTNDIPALTSLRGLGMYSTEVQAVNYPVNASFTHWDPQQPGGFTF